MPKSTDQMFFRWNGRKWVLKDGCVDPVRPPRSKIAHEESKRVLTPTLRAQLARDADYRCTYCSGVGSLTIGPDGDRWHLDHVIPAIRGGAHDQSNIVLACGTCNRAKGSRTPEEWKS